MAFHNSVDGNVSRYAIGPQLFSAASFYQGNPIAMHQSPGNPPQAFSAGGNSALGVADQQTMLLAFPEMYRSQFRQVPNIGHSAHYNVQPIHYLSQPQNTAAHFDYSQQNLSTMQSAVAYGIHPNMLYPQIYSSHAGGQQPQHQALMHQEPPVVSSAFTPATSHPEAAHTYIRMDGNAPVGMQYPPSNLQQGVTTTTYHQPTPAIYYNANGMQGVTNPSQSSVGSAVEPVMAAPEMLPTTSQTSAVTNAAAAATHVPLFRPPTSSVTSSSEIASVPLGSADTKTKQSSRTRAEKINDALITSVNSGQWEYQVNRFKNDEIESSNNIPAIKGGLYCRHYVRMDVIIKSILNGLTPPVTQEELTFMYDAQNDAGKEVSPGPRLSTTNDGEEKLLHGITDFYIDSSGQYLGHRTKVVLQFHVEYALRTKPTGGRHTNDLKGTHNIGDDAQANENHFQDALKTQVSHLDDVLNSYFGEMTKEMKWNSAVRYHISWPDHLQDHLHNKEKTDTCGLKALNEEPTSLKLSVQISGLTEAEIDQLSEEITHGKFSNQIIHTPNHVASQCCMCCADVKRFGAFKRRGDFSDRFNPLPEPPALNELDPDTVSTAAVAEDSHLENPVPGTASTTANSASAVAAAVVSNFTPETNHGPVTTSSLLANPSARNVNNAFTSSPGNVVNSSSAVERPPRFQKRQVMMSAQAMTSSNQPPNSMNTSAYGDSMPSYDKNMKFVSNVHKKSSSMDSAAGNVCETFASTQSSGTASRTTENSQPYGQKATSPSSDNSYSSGNAANFSQQQPSDYSMKMNHPNNYRGRGGGGGMPSQHSAIGRGGSMSGSNRGSGGGRPSGGNNGGGPRYSPSSSSYSRGASANYRGDPSRHFNTPRPGRVKSTNVNQRGGYATSTNNNSSSRSRTAAPPTNISITPELDECNFPSLSTNSQPFHHSTNMANTIHSKAIDTKALDGGANLQSSQKQQPSVSSIVGPVTKKAGPPLPPPNADLAKKDGLIPVNNNNNLRGPSGNSAATVSSGKLAMQHDAVEPPSSVSATCLSTTFTNGRGERNKTLYADKVRKEDAKT